jgi:tRNA (guanine-N7-)-methyltransferase
MACSSDASLNSTLRNQAAAHRPVRSYVLRQGRLTAAQQHALEHYWRDYGIDFSGGVIVPHQLFDASAAVTLEIGFGNGDSLLQQAIAQPGRNFIGIEVHRPGVGHLLHRAHQAGVRNLRVLNHDATEVLNCVRADTLDCVQLFFPDPWHKKRHHKRRIVQPAFIDAVHRCLLDGGRFHLATDWQNYAEYMLQLMGRAHGFSNASGQAAYASDTGRPATRFEQRGRRLGHGVWDLVYIKDPTQAT